jgi:hypothetical protein
MSRGGQAPSPVHESDGRGRPSPHRTRDTHHMLACHLSRRHVSPAPTIRCMFNIRSARFLGPNVKQFEIDAPRIAHAQKPGQLVIIRIDDTGERIPLTIKGSDVARGTITIVVQGIGKTTIQLNGLEEHRPRPARGRQSCDLDPRRTHAPPPDPGGRSARRERRSPDHDRRR